VSALTSYDRPHQILTPAEAQRLTQRIKLTAGSIRDGMFKLRNLVDEAKASNAWQVLGFASWTAYLADALGSEPMRLGRDERRELVDYLAGEGMSTRAIAPIVGADRKTVMNDIHVVQNGPRTDVPVSVPEAGTVPDAVSGEVTGEVEPPALSPVTDEPYTVDPATGEVTFDTEQLDPDGPVVSEHTVTEKTRTVVGLDGKTYEQKPSTPRRGSIVDDSRNAGWQLRKAVERVQRIAEDDRYTRNKADILAALQPHVDLALEVLTGL